MRRSFFVFALLIAPNAALAHPRIASDGAFIGARLEPGAALSVAYDLDIYLTGNRFVSIGPGASFSFLGEDGSEDGRRQDYLLAVDVLRVKVALNGGEDWLRPYLFVGGGFYWAMLPDQQGELHDVVLEDGTLARGRNVYEGVEDVGGLGSLGAGLDMYVVDSFAIALLLVTHLRFSETDRVPLFWAETHLGLRFGL